MSISIGHPVVGVELSILKPGWGFAKDEARMVESPSMPLPRRVRMVESPSPVTIRFTIDPPPRPSGSILKSGWCLAGEDERSTASVGAIPASILNLPGWQVNSEPQDREKKEPVGYYANGLFFEGATSLRASPTSRSTA